MRDGFRKKDWLDIGMVAVYNRDGCIGVANDATQVQSNTAIYPIEIATSIGFIHL